MRLTKTEKRAIEYWGLEYAESWEKDAGWFVYTTRETIPTYPGSGCECLESAVEWYKAEVLRTQAIHHKDGNARNNNLDNLAVVSVRENRSRKCKSR